MTMWNGKSVDVADVEFAKRAAVYFKEHPTKHTFTDGDIAIGERLAIKWAFDSSGVHSIAVVHIGSAVLVENP